MVSRDAPRISRGDGPPVKRSKAETFFLKIINKYAEKKRGSSDQRTATSLIFAAQQLHDQIKDHTGRAQWLAQQAREHPRPATPPGRDLHEGANSIFAPPAGSGKGEYETQVDAYNMVVTNYQDLQGRFRELQERVFDFQTQVKQLSDGHVRQKGKRMGKVEHDIESLSNASKNMDVEMIGCAREMGSLTAAM